MKLKFVRGVYHDTGYFVIHIIDDRIKDVWYLILAVEAYKRITHLFRRIN